MNTKIISDVGVSKIVARAIELGYSVALPFGDNQRYDLILVHGKKTRLAQCKTGRLRNGIIRGNACSNDHGSKRVGRNYKGDADIFLIYCPDNGKIYIGDVDTFPSHKFHLRVNPAETNRNNIRWAKDHEFNGAVA